MEVSEYLLKGFPKMLNAVETSGRVQTAAFWRLPKRLG
jgi:hypothetical protein